VVTVKSIHKRFKEGGIMKRSTWYVVGGVALVVAAVLIGLWLAGAFTSSRESEKVTVMFGFTPNVGYAAYYVAAAQGFYESEGLDVSFEFTTQGTGVAMQQVVAGQVQFSYGGDSAVFDAAAQGMPVLAVQKVIQKNLFGICAKPSSGIKVPADLKTRVLGLIAPTSGDTAVGRIILKETGIDFASMQTRYVGAQIVSSLLQDQVDAMGFYAPQLVAAQQLSGTTMNVIWGKDYTPLGSTYTFTSQAFAKENPEIVTRFVRATQKGLEYALAHEDAAVEAFIQYNPDSASSQALHAATWSLIAKEGFDWKNGKPSFELPSKDQWSKKVAQMVAAGVITSSVDVSSLVTDKFAAPAL
jgi:NitT/TauT family transport system substrate-binding protein